MKTSKLRFICAGIFIILTVSLCIFLCSKKHVEFCDESLTLESANSVWKESVYEQWNTWMSGGDIASYYSATDWNPRLITIMKRLWVDHVPFYFWLIRAASLIARGSASPWIGMGLNIFLTVLFELWLFYVPGRSMGEDKRMLKAVCIFSGLFFFSFPLFFSQVNLVRMYLLIAYEMYMLLWYMGSFYLNREEKKRNFAYAAVVACALITHYLFLPFFGILCIFVFAALLIGDRKRIPKFICMNISATILSCVMDPYWIYRLLRYNLMPRSDGNTGKKIELGATLMRTLKGLVNMPFHGRLPFAAALALTLLIFAAAVVILTKEGRKKTAVFFLLLIASIFCYLFIVYMMNGGAGRYHWPAFSLWIIPVYAAAIGIFIWLWDKKRGKLKVLGVLPGALLIAFLALNILDCKDGGIEYLYPDSVEDELRDKFADIPWVIWCEEHTYYEEGAAYKYMIPSQICFVSPNHPAGEELELPDEYILVCHDERDDDALELMEKYSGTRPGKNGEPVYCGSMGFFPVKQ